MSWVNSPPISAGASPIRILASAQAERRVIQDFCSLPDSIEWQLGQQYLLDRGNKAFTQDAEPVPYVVNNDGNLSAKAAEVFFASLLAAEQAGQLEPDIFVLELGIGVGLFARFFLDTVQRLCEQHGKDYYDRLCYVAGDYSEQMLFDACRHGIFTNHRGRYMLRVVDALCPERNLANEPIFEGVDRPFRAVFLNYLLDCLPAAVMKVDGDEVRQLCVRTCLARGVELGIYTNAGVDDLIGLAHSPDPNQRRELLELFGLLASEYDYRPVDAAVLPYGEWAVQFARDAGGRAVVHNFGAIGCLERLLGLVRDGGFILINDYGSTEATGADEFQHQRFSRSTFVGVNFAMLKSFFSRSASVSWIEPADEGRSIYARLLGVQVAAETAARFQDRFSKAAWDWLDEPVQQARKCLKEGRLEAAVPAFQQAVERQPHNWSLMNEVAHFLTFALRSPAAGLEMTKAALAQNPACSSDLYNMLGDSLYVLQRFEEAEQAFRRALEVNADDVRARLNLGFVYLQTKQYAAALERIAEGLALDRGAYRDGLLQKQSEILMQLAQRNEQERLRMANRISSRLATGTQSSNVP